MIRYVVTAVKKNGNRELAFDKNCLNTYDNKEDADLMLYHVHKNNSPERVIELIGTDLQVRPVECYPGGDPKTWYFES